MKRVLLGLTVLGLAGCNWGGQNHGYQYGGSHNYYNGYGHNAPMPKPHYSRVPRTSLEFSAGAEEITGGNILPTRVSLGGPIDKLTYKDTYDTGWRASGGIAHDLARRTTVTAKGVYKQADSKNDLVPVFVGPADGVFSGTLSDYKSYGAEVGVREYLNDQRSGIQFRPYIGATVGAAYLESIDANGIAGTTGPMEIFESEWVPTASAVLGVEVPMSNQISMGVESGIRYEGKRDSNGSLFETTDAYSVPVTLRGRFRF